jgi:hypothetical protein
MATRKQVREAVYSEFETSVDGLVPAENITQEQPDSTEDLPTVVHNDAYREVPMNNGQGPTGVQVTNGRTLVHEHSKPMEAQFTVLIMSESESIKEDIYEALRTHFEQYETPIVDESDIHPDIFGVEVTDVNSQDNEEREPIARGDSLTINVRFERIYERDVNPADEVVQTIGGDGITDVTRTTN